MHPSSSPDPHQPPGQGQQPQYPQQGGYGGYPQGPAAGQPYGAPGGPVPPPPQYGAAPGAPDTMPGAATTVRVLMFIGGPIGIILGLILGGVTLLGVGVGAAAGSASEASGSELTAALGVLGALGALVALIPLVYGVASTWLAAVMGRRRTGVYWGVVAFNIVALLILVLHVFAAISMEGAPGSLIPFVFHATMTGLMFAPKVRAFYGV
ncbi:hypothetical protein GCM10007079_40250 [Nocardiopsis terrae]|uniref:Integral membrane protein n=1 Tax=Nocardiopsis terrae TaxID=372655 RepID=A0ABR9HEG3_9ACTN|nr:hypothetical protein [Nocardiopsis terrae]MBE1457411.1 hypothetical protein [Nocardiopsis terrae]GHC92053.1 hypothetical protein GCM10007079_40250 [Nocardiopsis terrae]